MDMNQSIPVSGVRLLLCGKEVSRAANKGVGEGPYQKPVLLLLLELLLAGDQRLVSLLQGVPQQGPVAATLLSQRQDALLELYSEPLLLSKLVAPRLRVPAL